MTELLEKDLPALNFIVEELAKSGTYSLNANDLKKNKLFNFGKTEFKSLDDMLYEESKEFIRLLHILDEFGVAECSFEQDCEFAKPNSFTKQFKLQNGFKNEFDKQEKSKLRENKQDEILDLDITLKRFESKIGRKLMYFTIIISFLSFLITILTLEFWQTDESTNEQKNQVETPLLNKKEEIQKDTLN